MMNRTAVLGAISATILVVWSLTPTFAKHGDTAADFEEKSIAMVRDNFDFSIAGGGHHGRWRVVRDSTAIGGTALEQSSEDPLEEWHPLAIYKSLSLKNFAVSTRFKLIDGTTQSAGIAFLFLNLGTYYFVGASALEGRVDFFRVYAGTIERVGGTETNVTLECWHVLSVVAENDHFTVSLDNAALFTAWDRTILGDGRIGLWTGEDDVIRFDQLEIRTRQALAP